MNKKLVVSAVALLAVVAVAAGSFVFFGSPRGEEGTPRVVEKPDEFVTVQEPVQLVVPRTVLKGVIESFEQSGSTATLVIKIGGDAAVTRRFTLTARSIIFHSGEQLAISATRLTAGLEVYLYTEGDAVVAVIVGSGTKMITVGVISNTSILGSTLDVRLNFRLGDVTIKNALTGSTFNFGRLRQGDLVFFSANSPNTTQSKDGVVVFDYTVSVIVVYPRS